MPKTHSYHIEIMSKTHAQHVLNKWNIHIYIYTVCIYMSKDFLTNIKPRFSIYPPMCPPFLIYSFFLPPCSYLLEPARLEEASLCSCCVTCCFPRVVSPLAFRSASGNRPPGVAPFPLGCAGLPQQSTALDCASLDQVKARLVTVLFLPIVFPFVVFHLLAMLVPVLFLPRLCAASIQLMALPLQT